MECLLFTRRSFLLLRLNIHIYILDWCAFMSKSRCLHAEHLFLIYTAMHMVLHMHMLCCWSAEIINYFPLSNCGLTFLPKWNFSLQDIHNFWIVGVKFMEIPLKFFPVTYFKLPFPPKTPLTSSFLHCYLLSGGWKIFSNLVLRSQSNRRISTKQLWTTEVSHCEKCSIVIGRMNWKNRARACSSVL